jgi:hypothetical protein
MSVQNKSVYSMRSADYARGLQSVCLRIDGTHYMTIVPTESPDIPNATPSNVF